MKRKIGCLHAHYSNIEYIQKAIASNDLELVHFVDPGLMSRIASDETFDLTKAQNKVNEQIEWIASTKVDAILVTCTNYIALLDDEQLKTSVPIIKIDEPFFHYVCSITEPQVLLFTNPATVEGTMKRLNEFATTHAKPINIDVQIIENTFELIMQGKKEQYVNELSNYIKGLLISNQNKIVSVAQLSMVETAEKIECEMGDVKIGNPLKTLVTHIESSLQGLFS